MYIILCTYIYLSQYILQEMSIEIRYHDIIYIYIYIYNIYIYIHIYIIYIYIHYNYKITYHTLNIINIFTRIFLIAATISTRLFGRGTSTVPMYCNVITPLYSIELYLHLLPVLQSSAKSITNKLFFYN